MKPEACGHKNPLLREGKSQNQRFTEGLATDYVLVDERSTADLLVWASKFAAELNYFNAQNELDGDWTDFVQRDISTRIALIMVTDLEDLQDQFKAKAAAVLAPDLTEEVRLERLNELFALILSAAETVDTWVRQVADHTAFQLELRNTIKSRLRRHMRNLVEFAKGAETLDVAVPPANRIDLSIVGYSLDWIEQPENQAMNWATWLTDLHTPPNHQAYGTGAFLEQVATIVERLEFTFRGFYEGQFQSIRQAEKYLEETLGSWDTHKPHMALFITFLLLFKHAQNHLNKLTERHLDFYYEEVLRLSEKAATPDEVHLVFTLAKNVLTYKLAQGTELTAGKDAEGKPRAYGTDQELIVNTGTVAELKSVFRDDDNHGRVYAAPVANSANGSGKPFASTATGGWRPFGSSQQGVADDETTMPRAEMGLAVSSPILRLGEGRRYISVKLHFDADAWQAYVSSRQAAFTGATFGQYDFVVYLTGEKGWVEFKEAPNFVIETGLLNHELDLVLSLDEEAEPIVPYKAKVHGTGYDTTEPILRIMVNNDQELDPYGHLRLLRLLSIDLSVYVEGARALVVQNDQSVLKADKNFQPFGPKPVVGSNFYIGHHEAFSKTLDSFQLNIEWANPPDDFPNRYLLYNGNFTKCHLLADLEILDRKQWFTLGNEANQSNSCSFVTDKNGTTQQVTLNDKITLFQDIDLGGPSGPIRPDWTNRIDRSQLTRPIPPPKTNINIKVHKLVTNQTPLGNIRQVDLPAFKEYTSDVTQGFVRLVLGPQDFGHGQYVNLYARQAIRMGRGATPLTAAETALDTLLNNPPLGIPPLPFEPYTPEIKGISLDYVSKQTIDLRKRPDNADAFDNRVERVFHLHPFGIEEVHPYNYDPGLLGYTPADGQQAVVFLMPQLDGEGTLYIGLQGMNLEESNTIALLFQVLEGTASPDVEKPTISWAYRAEGKWVAFSMEQVVSDTTNELVTSGILKFSIPEEATTSHKMLTDGLLWIRGTSQQDTEGFADVVAIYAQAVKATFKDNNNALSHLAQALPAETISKLKVKAAEVKGVLQPYASFNGKMQEESKSFHMRVSERLRHKDRAITIWDYETMVLERFPSVYRVKCLNHTSGESQIHPGHVYVVAVSNLVNKNAVDPLKPRISVNTLDQIKNYLSGKISPFVHLEVQNPAYEEVRVKFQVRFNVADTGFYLKQLNEDIIRFLTPWAYEAGADISFEGKLHSSVILNFVEHLDYVDFLTDFRMYHIPKPEFPDDYVEVTEAIATTPMSILVSAESHDITLYEGHECNG